MTTENKHCGKHDKIYSDDKPCPGCETEKAEAAAAENPSHGEEGHEHQEGDEENGKTTEKKT